MRKVKFVQILCICTLAMAAALPTMADVLPFKYRIEPVLRNVTSPQAMALSPDGRIFYLERTTGNVRIIQQGRLVATPFVTVSVPASSPEGGLLGIALHPSFASNGWVYLYYTKSANGKNRIERYTAVGNTGTSAYVVLDDIGPTTVGVGEDNGGGLVFGTDGYLYAGVGVMENDGQASMDTSLLGKVLQITFNADGTVNQVNQFAKGFRNVAGLAVNKNTGTLYGTDNYDTDDTCDETNVVRSGQNFGWDVASCGDGNQQAPLQTISPQTGVAAVAAYTGSKLPAPRVCASDATRQENLHTVCSNNTSQPCWTNGYCSNNTSKSCAFSKVCSGNETVKCSTNADCTAYSSGWTCIDFCGTGNTCQPYCGTGNTCQPICGWDGLANDVATNPLFVAGQGTGTIVRDVLSGAAYDTKTSATDFYNPANDPTTSANCPNAIKDLDEGKDGWLYAVSGDSTATKNGIYRILYDEIGSTGAAPREVSATPYFPLSVNGTDSTKTSLKISWEDLKAGAWGCSTGHCPTGSKSTKYTVWSGSLTSPFAYSHSALIETNGTVENDALLQYTYSTPADSRYFLVSSRAANLEGSLGKSSAGAERTGYATTDLCTTIGYGTYKTDLDKCSAAWSHSYPDQDNRLWNLSDFRGKAVLLSFGQYG